MKDLIIFGLGAIAEVATVYLESDSSWRITTFTVHDSYRDRAEFRGRPVVPFERLRETHPPDRHAIFVAIGYRRLNRARAELYDQCRAMGYECITYVSSRAMRSPETTIGEHCFVFEANVIQPFVNIGNNVIMWSGNHIGHHTTIGDHGFIASHAVISGNVTVGRNCFIGVNATIRDGVTIGDDCVIGASAVIMKDVPAGSVYAVRATERFPKPSSALDL